MNSVEAIMSTIWRRKVPFFVVFFVVLVVTYGILFALDFYPEPIQETDTPEAVDTEHMAEVAKDKKEIEAPRGIEAESATTETLVPDSEAYPERIIFDALGTEVAVLNPQSSDVAELDAALLKGVVRHPYSADFREPGTMFILGHSSYLPNVFNKNFQAFNGIQNLEWGDTIRVHSSATEYIYRVDKVYEAKASDAYIPLQWERAKLVLATCDSFGAIEDRFMVEATLIDTRTL